MARLMSSTELQQRMQTDDNFILVDVLTEEDFRKEHIPGATNIPLETLQEAASKHLNKNQRIVVYGNTHDSPRSNEAAALLERLGFRKVSDFDGGINAWKSAGFLTEGEAALRD